MAQPLLLRRREAVSAVVLLEAAVRGLSSLVGGAVVILLLAEVLLRFLGAQVPPSFEELGDFLFVWWVFLGASLNVRIAGHPRITVVLDRLPATLSEELSFASELTTLAYFTLLTWLGFRIALDAGQPSLALGIPMTYPYLALPVGGGLMTVFALSRLGEHIRSARRPIVTCLVLVAAGCGLFLVARGNTYVFMLCAAVLLFLIGVPVAIVLGLITLGALGFSDPTMLINYVIRLFDGLNNFVLLSIPLFILTGTLMFHGGISRRLVDLASALVGRIRGGLAVADIIASVFFADLSGSAVSDTAAIGTVMIPGMVERGYSRGFATALQSAAGSLGMLFPPSITMILYAWVANVSIARLFLSSIVPGLLVAATFAVVAYVTARRRNFPMEPAIPFRELRRRLCAAGPALVTPVLILGGILSGLFTATEAGVVAAVYAAFVGLIIHHDFSLRQIPMIWAEATVLMSRILFIAANAIAFSWVLIIHEGPQHLATLLGAGVHSPLLILVAINLFLVPLHVVMEGASTVVAIVPVLLPILADVHVDPVYFGVVVMLNSATGLLMPPVGLCLYISSSISGERLEVVAREALPFVLAVFADIALLLLFPQLATFVPRLLM